MQRTDVSSTVSASSFTKALDKKLPWPTLAIERFSCGEACGFVVPHKLLVPASPAINSQEALASGQAVGMSMIQKRSPNALPDEPSGSQEKHDVQAGLVRYRSV
jgi:hypothetical protein